MFKIGEFSRISRVPTKTLRYYDEIGLFTPARVDASNGYRLYSADQLPRLNRILVLKEMGLSLTEIGRLLDESLSPEELRGMFRLKEAELRQQVRLVVAHRGKQRQRHRQHHEHQPGDQQQPPDQAAPPRLGAGLGGRNHQLITAGNRRARAGGVPPAQRRHHHITGCRARLG